jgi:hypothetical protein
MEVPKGLQGPGMQRSLAGLPEQSSVQPLLLELLRGKRDLGLGATFATYAICSNLVDKAIEHFWPNPAVKELYSRTDQIKDFLNGMVKEHNVTMLALTAVQEAVTTQAILLQHNSAELQLIAYSYPELMVTSAHIIAKIVQTGSQLDRLRISFRARKPDLELISELTDTSFQDAIDQDTIPKYHVELYSPGAESIEMKFAARNRDLTTEVYQVEAFDFWANLTEATPALLHYDGPKFLIYNHTNHCVRGVTDMKNAWVNARCAEPGYEDASLAQWSTIVTASDPWSSTSRTAVKESWPYVFAYCFPYNITYKGEAVECPPYVFRMNASEPFGLSNGYAYNPSAVEFNAAVEMVTMNVHSIHFRNQSC